VTVKREVFLLPVRIFGEILTKTIWEKGMGANRPVKIPPFQADMDS